MFATRLARCRALALAVLVLLLAFPFAGCRRGPVSKLHQEDAADSAPLSAKLVSTVDGKAQVFRITDDLLLRRKEVQREPLSVDLSSLRVSVGLRDAGKLEKSDLAKYVEHGENSIRIAAGDQYSSVEANLPFRADHYNVLEVTMKADVGTRCSMSWSSDLEPSVLHNKGVGTPIFADKQFHTYRIPLDPYTAETWQGQIKSFAFYPSDQPANVELTSLRFLYAAPEAPARVTLEAQTHEALYGTLPPWRITVPPSAALDLHLGMLPRAWEDGRTGRARFHVALESGGKRVDLLDETLEPATVEPHRMWVPFEKDLSEYAGQEVTLHFSVDCLELTAADYAFWGNPIVYSKVQDIASIPVILIVCDTLRADHLSTYGYLRETSPHLDAFAKEAVVFENAIAQETWTLPSHGTMFTGLYPKNHGLTANANLPESTVTLAEALRGAGYLTAGYTGFSFWLYPWRGFAHGFDVYNVPDWRFRGIFETQELVLGWMENHPVPNQFVFFHNFDVHSKPARQYDGLPYGPDDPAFLHFSKEFTSPPTFEREGRTKIDAEAFMLAANRGELTPTQEEVAYCIALYDDCIRMVDHSLHGFFEKMKELGLYDRALIIVTSDHGEEFGEHGEYGHGTVYEPSARVPLIIRFPQGHHAGTRHSGIVQVTDLYPTVLSVIGVPLPHPVDGQDLKALLEKSRPPQGKAYIQRMNQRAIRTDAVKLIRDVVSGNYELFDMTSDKQERNDLYETPPGPIDEMRADLLDFFQVNPEGWHFAYSSPDPEWRGELEVTADSALDTAILAQGRDRQNMILKGNTIRVIMGRDGKDELILRTTDPSTKLVVTATSGSEMTLAAGNQELRTGTQFTLNLDPAEGEFPLPSLDPKGKTALRVWYVPPTTKRSAAKSLSEDVVEELRALGYTGE
ncbi:MAG: sulfatase [Candidatus Hydrogenedentes bacterium]|nr:sulfatase [Candidatus Hydrogenedentota bacterium]